MDCKDKSPNVNIINGYKLDETTILGKGAYSTVYRGLCCITGNLVAIKKIDLQKQDPERVRTEIEIMQKINHPNIICSSGDINIDTPLKTDFLYIVMEYCNYGTLDDVVLYNKKIIGEDNCKPNIYIDLEKNTHYYLLQLKNAMNYIWKLGYVHRDIKTQNILLNYPGILDGNNAERKYHMNQKIILKLADFGLSKQHNNDKELMTRTICGTPYYMAPELLLDGAYNSKVDMWAFGVIMYVMLFQTYPIEATGQVQLKIKMKVLDIDFNHSNNFTTKCFDLLTKLLDKDYNSRITWESFFNHDWFTYWDNNTSMNYSNSSSGEAMILSNNSINKSFPPKIINHISEPNKPSQKLSNLSKMKINKNTNNQSNTQYSYKDIRIMKKPTMPHIIKEKIEPMIYSNYGPNESTQNKSEMNQCSELTSSLNNTCFYSLDDSFSDSVSSETRSKEFKVQDSANGSNINKSGIIRSTNSSSSEGQYLNK